MGIYFATASRDRTARLWSTDRTSALRVYAGHLSDVDVWLSFCFNAMYLTSAPSVSDSIRTHCIWRPGQVTGRRVYGMCKKAHASECLLVIKVLSLLLHSVLMAAISPVLVGFRFQVKFIPLNPSFIAGEDLAINLWDLGSGRRIKKMTGHTSSIYSLAFSAESSLLVSGGADWSVRCWDVKSAGGLPGKTRENGVNGNGSTMTDSDFVKPDDENIATYVSLFLMHAQIQ